MREKEWLADREMRGEYGAATLKYDMGALLVEARVGAHLTQEELGNRAGVSEAYIAKVERGEGNPTLGRIGALLAAMEVKVDLHIAPLVHNMEGTAASS